MPSIELITIYLQKTKKNGPKKNPQNQILKMDGKFVYCE
jgi:hypothetical protein